MGNFDLAGKILKELVRFPSIAAKPEFEQSQNQIFLYLDKFFKKLGFKITIIGNKNSLIVAHLDLGRTKTIGFYAHYDVQAPEPLANWHSEPFVLAKKNGYFYGRGVADDKGHLAQLLATLEILIAQKNLKNNLLLVVEGEEEVGSAHFAHYLREVKILLTKPEVYYILDAGVKDINTPMIEYGLRGMMAYELVVSGPKSDLHSGLAGNLVENPAQTLVDFLSSLKTGQVINLSGFYDRIVRIKSHEAELLHKRSLSEKDKAKEFGVTRLTLPKEQPYYLASKVWPSLDINSLFTGYTDGFKTVINHEAKATFSFRLVPSQDPKKINQQLEKQIAKFFKTSANKYSLKLLGATPAFVCNLHEPLLQKSAQILNKHFSNKTIFNRSGGSIPAAGILNQLSQKPVVITGFTNPDCALHAPNENYNLELFNKGLEILPDLINQ